MTSRVSVGGIGTEDGQGTLRLTFHDDGSLYLEDDSGVGLWGTWGYDDEGELSAQIYPQSVEGLLRTAYGFDEGFGVTVDAVDLTLQVGDGQEMNVTFGLTASLTDYDPDVHETVRRKWTYDVSAAGPRD